MSSRFKAISYVFLTVAVLHGVRSLAQRPEPTEREIGAWYQHPQGIYRVPLGPGWQVLRGVRGKEKDEQFDTLVDPTRQYSILCWRSSEKVSDEMAALKKYREEKLAELASNKNVHAAGMSINRVPMMRITYPTAADRMVSRISAVKNGQRIVINTVSPIGSTAGQLPKLVEDLIAAIEFPDRGVTIDAPPGMTQLPPSQDSSVIRPTFYPPTSVLESQKATVSSAGGGLTLRGGIRLVVPPDAVASDTEFLIERLKPEVFNADDPSKYVVLNCTASVPQFEQPVEIRLPISFSIPEDSPPPLAGTLNEETGLLELCPTRFETKGTETELVMTTDHFCIFVFPTWEAIMEWFVPPPASAGPIETGIYKQGASPFCWAMSMHTQARAHKAGTYGAYNIIGDIGLSFVGPIGIRWRPSIKNWFQSRTGQQPERLFWDGDYLSASDEPFDNLKRYVRREVGRNGRPVLLGRQVWTKGHSWLIVGYDDQGNFIVHDSQDPPDIAPTSEDMGYYKVSAKDLGFDFAAPVRDSYVTVSIPLPLDPQRSLATLNIPPKGVWFKNPSMPNTFVFGWTHSAPGGYEWRQARKANFKQSEAYDAPLPPTVEELVLGSENIPGTGLEVINGSRTETKRLTVLIKIGEIKENGEKVLLYEKQLPFLDVAPNRRRMVNLTIPVKEYRLPEDTRLTEYRFLATLREGGAAVDQASFAFEICPGQLFKMEVTPEQAKQAPPFAVSMIPDRIFWCEPTKPNATEAQLTLYYASSDEGRPYLSMGKQPGVSPKITLRALRVGDEYVVRGPALDDIARQAEFCARYTEEMILAGVTTTRNEGYGFDKETYQREKEEVEARRRSAENIRVSVEKIEFRIRPNGDTLRLTVRGKATSILSNEAPIVSEAGVASDTAQLTVQQKGILEVVGKVEKK